MRQHRHANKDVEGLLIALTLLIPLLTVQTQLTDDNSLAGPPFLCENDAVLYPKRASK